MSIRVTITKPNVFNEYGIAMLVGTTYTVDDAFGLSLITQQKATDTDASLTNPGVTAAGPVEVVYCNAATLAAPSAQMLASYNTIFALDVAPFTQYRTTGTALIPNAPYVRDSSGNITGLAGADDATASTIWLFGTSAQQATGKEKYAFNRLDTNAGSVSRPTNLYVEQATNLGVTMTCDFHAMDVYCYGGGSNTRYTANVRLYCVEGQAHFTGSNNQTLGGAVGVYGLAKSSGNAGTTLQVAKGVQGATQNTGAGTTTLAAAFYGVSPTNSGGGTLTTAAGLYLEDVTAGTTNYAIYTQAGRVRFFAGTATPAGGTANVGMTMGSAGVGVFWGSGAPALSAAQGSIYLRTDGGANTRIYSNSDGGTTWQPMTNAA